MHTDEKVNYECIGYHGTDSASFEKILEEEKFLKSCSDEEWLGDGVYFFENDKKQALYFVSRARKIKNYKIVSASIRTNKLLDLIDMESYESFEKIARSIQDRYKKRKDQKPRILVNSVILNMMYKIKPYEVVRAAFSVPCTHKAPRTNIQPMQIQICVRDHRCIYDIKEAVFNE